MAIRQLNSFLACRFLACRFGEGNGTPLQYSCLENHMDSLKESTEVPGTTSFKPLLPS